jgi:hypothetical protein
MGAVDKFPAVYNCNSFSCTGAKAGLMKSKAPWPKKSVGTKSPKQEAREILGQHLAALLGPGALQGRLVKRARHRLSDDA